MGCVHSRLLKKSQRKHFAPNASLLAALVRLDGKQLLAESSLCSSSTPTPGSPAGTLGIPGGSNNPTWTLLHPGNPLYFNECLIWYLCALHWCGEMWLKALSWIWKHQLPCQCEWEWGKWEKWLFLVRRGDWDGTVCGLGDLLWILHMTLRAEFSPDFQWNSNCSCTSSPCQCWHSQGRSLIKMSVQSLLSHT